MATLDVDKARSHFPSLASGFIYADNAGGSQISKEAIDCINDYYCNTNVQLGADYSVSVRSTQRVYVEAPKEILKLINAEHINEIVFSASSSMNLENLARGLDNDVKEGDEFIVTGEHETNAGPWKKLAARRGAIIKYWPHVPVPGSNPYQIKLRVEDLLPLISSKTRLVAFTACSNILGSIVPVKDVIAAVRAEARAKGSPKVEISVDCVAYAPHRLIDVREWDVDYCVFSVYKVYGPHTSVLYVRKEALEHSVSSINHHFLSENSSPYKIQPGGPGYELVYGTTGIMPYLLSLTPSNDLHKSFEAIANHEQTLIRPLLKFLTDPKQRERGVRVVGDEEPGLTRVPTICFVVVGGNSIKSKEVVRRFDEKGGIGIRYGHFYAYSLVAGLQPPLDPDDGVVRISLVHYNTVKEVETIISVLEEILG